MGVRVNLGALRLAVGLLCRMAKHPHDPLVGTLAKPVPSEAEGSHPPKAWSKANSTPTIRRTIRDLLGFPPSDACTVPNPLL